MLVQRVFQICFFSLCCFVSKQILISKSPLAPFASFVYTIQAKGIVLEHQNVTGPGWCKTLEYRYFMLGWDKLTFLPSSCSLLSMTCTRRIFHLKIIKASCHCCVTLYTKELRSDHWYTSKIWLCSAKKKTVEAPLTATFFLPSGQKIHTLTLGYNLSTTATFFWSQGGRCREVQVKKQNSSQDITILFFDNFLGLSCISYPSALKLIPCEQSFLFCMAFSVYEVVRVTCLFNQLPDRQAPRTTS